VVDSAFWNRAARDEYKALIEARGGAWRLVYLKATPELLRQRLAGRSRRFDANAQFPVTDAMLDRFLGAFEEPAGEGEMAVEA
jgi:predicted kinase